MHDFTLPIRNPVFLFGILMLVVLVVPALCQKLKIPGIVGLIVSGALLGPFGTNLLYHGEGIQLLAKAGLLYLMFWAGLEINMVGFLRNRHKSLVFGGMTFLLPLLIGGLSAYYLLGFDWTGAILLASMFSTHTLISYPVVARLRVSKNEAVAITVGGTIITDTLALLILAVVSGMEQGELTGMFWVGLSFKILLFGGLVFGGMPRVARWFFQKVESDLTYQYVFVLAMLFTCSLLAELAGLEGIIGAFMAGLVLNRCIPHSSPLMERTGFVGQALFIPAFLFSVGMMINIGVLFGKRETLVMAFLLTSIAILTKWLAAYATQKIYHYTPVQRNLIFGLSSSHAAATIAIILIGFEIKLFDETVLNATVFLILVTCMVSGFATEKAARQLATDGTGKPSTHKKNQRILVPYSNPANVGRLLDFAFLLKMEGQTEPVRPLAVILDSEDVSLKIEQSRQLLKPTLQQLTVQSQTVSPIHRIDVNVASGIIRAAKELPATDIVIGWRPAVSATDKLFGTLHDNILEETSECLFVAHFTQPPHQFKRLCLAIPALIQKEPRFGDLTQRLDMVFKHLGLPIKWVSGQTIRKGAQEQNWIDVLSDSNDSGAEEDLFFHLHENVTREDLTVILSARKGSVSHQVFMDRLPGYLAEKFMDRSFVLVFPPL